MLDHCEGSLLGAKARLHELARNVTLLSSQSYGFQELLREITGISVLGVILVILLGEKRWV